MYVFNQSPDHLQQVTDWLKQGKLLAYPTESVWGIGCDAMCESAVKQILRIKNRPMDKGMIVITDSVKRIQPLLVALPHNQQTAIIQSWAGMTAQTAKMTDNNPTQKQATTWLLPLTASNPHINIPHWITGQHNCVAVRVIAHPTIQKLCQSMVSQNNPFGFIISTSCNPAGHTPAHTLDAAIDYFGKVANVGYLQGATLGYHLPSQIKDASTGNIIR